MRLVRPQADSQEDHRTFDYTGWTVTIPPGRCTADTLRTSFPMLGPSSSIGPARDRILEAAERLVVESGAARLTLDAVAQAAGVSKGGLLYHFPAKDSLLTALANRYAEGMEQCIEAAKTQLVETGQSRDLKAAVLGMLSADPRPRALTAVLLATAANEPALLEVIRQCVAQYTQELESTCSNFARAAIVTLAVDGLKMREALRISSFTDAQREQIVQELLSMAEQSYN
jgi:AcrR family transcriptional regulator